MERVESKVSLVLDAPEEEREEQPWDGWLLVVVCALLGLGLVMIFSASSITAQWQHNDSTFFLKRQLLFLLAAFALMYAGLRIDYRWYQRAVYPILGVTLALLVIVAMSGLTANNATRWIRVGGMTFQPGEWTKIAMAMVLAYSVTKKGEQVKSFTVGIVPHLAIVGLVVGLLMLQPDFGTSVLLLSMMFAVLFVAGTRISYILLALVCSSAAAYHLISSSPYRMKRVMAFLDPWAHQGDIAYQVTESMMAIGSGGIVGQGLGDGLGKLGFVPELETDFIGTAIAQELGFAGVVLIVVLYLLLVWRGIRIALAATDNFGKYLAFALTFLFGLQAAINLAVISGLVPTKGLTLPFISYGGSSLLCSMFGIGILLSISRCASDEWKSKRAEKDREREALRWERKRERIMMRRLEERR
ncbi:MAG: putative lipid II flippase FtsW [Deltaproteobacteria bacterium CG2_30_63_29]|nr:MAG: putative lipid II flippase FtsW [Deltaproteobacteria bacterium CG2_30_63_29]PJB34076.1 MAG: putative lipid II flippase FtsW [Deltaproteobacteria bacterium CG_4_9_14_3_um_filter_63_12]